MPVIEILHERLRTDICVIFGFNKTLRSYVVNFADITFAFCCVEVFSCISRSFAHTQCDFLIPSLIKCCQIIFLAHSITSRNEARMEGFHETTNEKLFSELSSGNRYSELNAKNAFFHCWP